MKKLVKKFLIQLFDPVAKRLGYVQNERQGAPINKNTLLDRFYSNLKELGFVPKHIVDVGANHGTWTREALRHFPNSKFTLLEPQYWMRESLEDLLTTNSKIKFHAVGAGKKSGTFKFTIVNRDDSCSFRYSEEEAKAKGFQQIEIPVVTLNELLLNTDIPEIIKIDAEGLDLEVLEGADNFFGKTEIFLVEAAVMSNKLENNLQKVVNFMDQKGYQLFDITDLNRPFKPEVLWLTELVFVLKKGEIDTKVKMLLNTN